MARRNKTYDVFDVSMQSPLVSTDQMAGLLNTLAQTPRSSKHDIITVRKSVAYDDDQLLAILNALAVLGFAGTSDGTVELTPVGQHYARAPTHERRLIFAVQLMQLPSVKLIQGMIASHLGHQVHGAEIVTELGHRYPTVDVERRLRQVVEWGRYAGVLFYDERTDLISLHTPLSDRADFPIQN